MIYSFDLKTALEDGGLGGLLVALIWAFFHWWNNRHPNQGKSQYEK